MSEIYQSVIEEFIGVKAIIIGSMGLSAMFLFWKLLPQKPKELIKTILRLPF